MSKRTMTPILLLFAIAAVIYAIYRSMAATITTLSNGQTVVYGQPQHGLTLGLCVFAGFCVLGAVLLSVDDKVVINQEKQSTPTTTTTSSNRVATNYPR